MYVQKKHIKVPSTIYSLKGPLWVLEHYSTDKEGLLCDSHADGSEKQQPYTYFV